MNNRKELLRVILAVAIIIVGITHFTAVEPYARIVPPQLPNPDFWVYLSGFFEILGGIGLLVPPVSQAAAWGLFALFIAVYPANINMAINHIKINEFIPTGNWFHAIRLPLQFVLFAWALWYTKSSETSEKQASIIPKRFLPKSVEAEM
ncbi:hypothetical protein CAL7716_098540 [Calothrix sp. PCC 7716]|nr:hypothetical protein CAL7716_098540 [Calothrix sp. PCC 7716]